LAQGESGRALGRRKQGNFVLFVEGSTRHDRVISNGSSYRLRRRETLIVHFGRSSNRIQCRNWDAEEVQLLGKRAHPQFSCVVCAIVEATGEIIARDLKRLNMGLLAAAKLAPGDHTAERGLLRCISNEGLSFRALR
jgi:hypothetical protein